MLAERGTAVLNDARFSVHRRNQGREMKLSTGSTYLLTLCSYMLEQFAMEVRRELEMWFGQAKEPPRGLGNEASLTSCILDHVENKFHVHQLKPRIGAPVHAT